jgi:hypothetical protein
MFRAAEKYDYVQYITYSQFLVIMVQSEAARGLLSVGYGMGKNSNSETAPWLFSVLKFTLPSFHIENLVIRI